MSHHRLTKRLNKRLVVIWTSYLGKIVNIFNPSQIDKTIQLGEQSKNIAVNDYTLHSGGLDFAFASSATAIVSAEFLKEECKIIILCAEELELSNRKR